MNPSPEFEAGDPLTYDLEFVAELTSIASQTILDYQEQGLLPGTDGHGGFDDESVYTLRRIEHLRRTYEANPSGIKLILELTAEVERLRAALRSQR
jgi:DNA-binding transcriptional MerR regulator